MLDRSAMPAALASFNNFAQAVKLAAEHRQGLEDEQHDFAIFSSAARTSRRFEKVSDADVETAQDIIAKAQKIVVFGGGRERLQIMGFAMRLYHMGLAAAVEGDMTTPPVGKGDLFIATC